MTWGTRSFLRTPTNERASSPARPPQPGTLDDDTSIQLTAGNRTNGQAAVMHSDGLPNKRRRLNEEFGA